jgi:Na+-driven multidrug efflux pump
LVANAAYSGRLGDSLSREAAASFGSYVAVAAPLIALHQLLAGVLRAAGDAAAVAARQLAVAAASAALFPFFVAGAAGFRPLGAAGAGALAHRGTG